IEPANLKYSKILGKPRRPKRFTIKYVPTGSASTFKKQTDNESSSSTLEYYGDVNTPFDNTCVQRYKWIKSLDTQKKCKENNHKWIFVACNDPETPLAEFRPTNIENEFDIVFLERAPIGWNPNIADRLSRFSGLSGGRASGFESLDGRESKQSSMYSFTSTISNVKSKQSFPVNSFNILAEDDGRYWQEYILASTVAIQDEVNSRKISFNKRIRNFFG
ncbi:10455_t:CDS:1, partial [Ambispora leptoticha]